MDSLRASPEFQMSLLLFVALGGCLIASRINQSAVIGLILVGLLVGPSALGLITYTDFVRRLAELGAVILLFVIGLEAGIIDQGVCVALVLMSLFTTIITPIVYRNWFFHGGDADMSCQRNNP